MRVAVLGYGRAGSALAAALGRGRRGVSLSGVWTRERTLAARPPGRGARGRAFGTLGEAAAASDVLLLCVPDAAIPEVARLLARSGGARGRILLCASGAFEPGSLPAAVRRALAVGSLHPLRALPSGRPNPRRPPLPPGTWFGVGGVPRARAAARAIAAALGGRSIDVQDRSRAAYHLAASVVANHSTVLAALALDMLRRRGGLGGPRIRAAFASLLRSAADRVEEEGPERGLTGPAARGDAPTLLGHLRSLRGKREAPLRRVYALLSAEAVRIARRRGDLPAAKARALERLFRGAGR